MSSNHSDPEQPPPSEDEANLMARIELRSMAKQPNERSSVSKDCSPLSESSDGLESPFKSCDSITCWKSPPKAMHKPVVAEKYREVYTKLLSKCGLVSGVAANSRPQTTPPNLAKCCPVIRPTSQVMHARSFLPAPSKMTTTANRNHTNNVATNKCRKEKGINVLGNGGTIRGTSKKSTVVDKSITSKKKKKIGQITTQNGTEVGVTRGAAISTAQARLHTQPVDTKEASKPPTDEEMEELNDELSDLNTSVATLRYSMDSVVGSLSHIDSARRTRTKVGKSPVGNSTTVPSNNSSSKKTTTSSPTSGTIVDVLCRASVDYGSKYTLDRFVNGRTRTAAFAELLAEHQTVAKAMAHFETFFNSEGCFRRLAFESQTELQLSRPQYRDCLRVIKGLSGVVTAILKAYNENQLKLYLDRSFRYR